MMDTSYIEALNKWLDNHNLWLKGQHPDQLADPDGTKQKYYAAYYENPPSVENYNQRQWTTQEATAYQLYETITEGTPVGPVFPDLEKFKQWMVYYGVSSEQIEMLLQHLWTPTIIIPDQSSTRKNQASQFLKYHNKQLHLFQKI